MATTPPTNDKFFMKNISTLTNNFNCDIKFISHYTDKQKATEYIEAYIKCNHKIDTLDAGNPVANAYAHLIQQSLQEKQTNFLHNVWTFWHN